MSIKGGRGLYIMEWGFDVESGGLEVLSRW